MIITFPATTNNFEKKAKNFGNSGFILHEKASHYYWSGQSPLSIKTFFAGRALYTLGSGYYAVDDTRYLIVNHNQPYTIAIEAEDPVESFCLFFDSTLVADLYSSLTQTTQTLLTSPYPAKSTPLLFFERTYPHDHLLSPALFWLRQYITPTTLTPTTLTPATLSPSVTVADDFRLYELYTNLLILLLQVHYNVFKEIEALPAIRASTRTEIYRRLYRAREYAQAFYQRPLTVPELAAVASLSPSHFLRLFKQLFHQTPHQYLIELRLAQARHLLIHSETPITEICFSLGFESLGSFSWLFTQRTGCSPLAFRRQKK